MTVSLRSERARVIDVQSDEGEMGGGVFRCDLQQTFAHCESFGAKIAPRFWNPLADNRTSVLYWNRQQHMTTLLYLRG